jgi:PKD repeat protein
VDDGVRLWIDDSLVIDDWQDGSMRLLQAERGISGGQHRVKIEYYERSGAAQIAVNWSRKQEPVNRPPQAVPGGPYTVDEGGLVTFDGDKSKDPDGRIVKYEWDFDHDGRAFTSDAEGKTVSTRYPDGPATIVVALRVTDDKGANHVATVQVKVKNVGPTAEAGGPYAGQVEAPITMSGTATDPGSIDQTGLVYVWDFGDGTQSSGPNVSHSYATPGGYVVKLTVTDKDGAQGSDTVTVQVIAVSQPPTAVISGPTQGLVGEPLIFSGSGSSDGDGGIVSYVWDFGDGATGMGFDVIHSYSATGTYQVTLTVTDSGGLTAKARHTLQITELSPVNQPPTAVIRGPTHGLVGETLSFDGGNSDDDGQIVDYAWDFGDGSTGSGFTVTNVYTGAGSYQVALVVTDDGGLIANATHSVQIEPEPTVTSERNLSQ